MTVLPAPTVTPTAYRVSLLPEGRGAHVFDVTVEYRGRGTWAVLHSGYCLGTGGDWEYESIPSERADAWIASHRFPLEEALDLASEAAPHVTVNGRTAAEVLLASWAREGPIPAGGNAEDCPRCTDPNPPYPFICPGHAIEES